MRVKFSDLFQQYNGISREIDQAIEQTILRSEFIGGKAVREFEDAFSNFVGSSHCVSVANGTDALEIALESLSLPKGSKVLVPANTFIATAEAVTRNGLCITFYDIKEDFTFDERDILKKISADTSALIVVHLYGQPQNMDVAKEISRSNGLKLIEDCSQAHGTYFEGRHVGIFGDAGTFSFYPGKTLGAYGDGGAIVLNNQDLALRARMISNHGRIDKYSHVIEGRNSRLDSIQAAILDVKLNSLAAWVQRRRKNAQLYRNALEGEIGVILPSRQYDDCSSFHLYVIRTSKRDELMDYLSGVGVETGIHYPKSLTNLPPYLIQGERDKCTVAGRLSGEILSLPIGEHLGEDEVGYVAERVKAFFND